MNTSRITRMLSPYSGCTLNCWQSCRGGYLSLTTFHENALHIERYLLCFLSICTDPKEASVTSNISEISSISSTSSSPPGALLWVTVWHFYFFFLGVTRNICQAWGKRNGCLSLPKDTYPKRPSDIIIDNCICCSFKCCFQDKPGNQGMLILLNLN